MVLQTSGFFIAIKLFFLILVPIFSVGTIKKQAITAPTKADTHAIITDSAPPYKSFIGPLIIIEIICDNRSEQNKLFLPSSCLRTAKPFSTILTWPHVQK